MASLRSKLVEQGKTELKQLLSLKRDEKNQTVHKNEPFDDCIHEWDFSYYVNMLQDKDFGVNEEEVREYFPMTVVTEQMLEIYQEVLFFGQLITQFTAAS